MCENRKFYVLPPDSSHTIRKIALTQFRNYSAAHFEFTAPVTCITGPNGSGKTNLLDAVYYLCYTKSYFSAYQQYSVQHGMDGFRITGTFSKEDGRTELISAKWKGGKKEMSADGAEYDKPTDHIGKYAAVMIAPDDMELINDGSDLRRRWLDSILSQTDKNYLEALLQYQRVLLQRNAWMKLHSANPPFNSAELDYYNDQLSQHGSYIYIQRRQFIEAYIPLLRHFYLQLSGGREDIHISYASDLTQRPMAQWLHDTLQQDLRMQRTTRGIHKDDLIFSFNDTELKQFGSQGQKKSYLFALKLAQYGYLSMTQGHLPVLLLDDIFEKLDQQRMEALLRIIRGPAFGQVILTDTHAERVRKAFGEGVVMNFIEL